jgi:hypothetical protein
LSDTPNAIETSPVQRSRWPHYVLLAVIGLVILLVLARFAIPPTPSLLTRARTQPVYPTSHGDAWYWLEHSKDAGSRLVRAAPSGVQTLAQADAIPRYDAAGENVVWAAREGKRWSIYIAAADGTGKRVLWSGLEEPRGLRLAEGRLYWLRILPPALPESGPFPPLSARMEVIAIPREGGAPALIAQLWEAEDGEALGVHAGALYVAAYRTIGPGSMAIYRISLTGDMPPRRIVGESRRPHALLTRDGALYWMAPSPEASGPLNVFCIRRMGKDGRPETLSDWLPAGAPSGAAMSVHSGGRLFETRRGVVCVDGDFQSRAWSAGRHDALPQPQPQPAGYYALAAGESELLLIPAGAPGANIPLYRIPLP